jgi:hypothetical protein
MTGAQRQGDMPIESQGRTSPDLNYTCQIIECRVVWSGNSLDEPVAGVNGISQAITPVFGRCCA